MDNMSDYDQKKENYPIMCLTHVFACSCFKFCFIYYCNCLISSFIFATNSSYLRLWKPEGSLRTTLTYTAYKKSVSSCW